MNKQATLSLSAILACGASAFAQGPGYLATYSQPEITLSGSGGTVLANLLPNEISYLDYAAGPCPNVSAEKWMPRTAAHVMAGDENADGDYFNPTIFGSIDALLSSGSGPAVASADNQRTVFWSPSAAMGNNVTGTPFRPGDVARIVRNGAGEGQVEYFMRQDQFNAVLGLPAGFPIDVDAIAFSPNYGVWFSIDSDTPAITDCGPVLVRDGDVLCVPPWGLTYTADLRIASVVPLSAVIVHTEAQMDAFTVNAQVSNRFGACIPNVIDVESLEIDLFGPTSTTATCVGIAIQTPTLLYSTETGTGASVLTTQLGGQIHNTICSPVGTACGFGPTLGPQFGVRPTSLLIGAPSYVNALSYSRACHNVLEPQQHVINVFPFGAPAGFTMIDYGSEFAFNVALIEIVPPVVPWSLPAFPFSQLCFPDLYAPSIIVHAWPLIGTWGSFPMVAIPTGWQGKVLYQNVGFSGSGLELSTPAVIDVQ